jgi:hypothetical protein
LNFLFHIVERIIFKLSFLQIEDKGALSFQFAIVERDPCVQLLFNGNPISESTSAIIDTWYNERKFPPKEEENVAEPPIYAEQNDNNELLQQEINSLKADLLNANDKVANLHKQVDFSSIRITELEKQLYNESLNKLRQQEMIQQLTLRNSSLVEERSVIMSSWESEKALFLQELRDLNEKDETTIRQLLSSRESLQKQVDKLLVRILRYCLFQSFKFFI